MYTYAYYCIWQINAILYVYSGYGSGAEGWTREELDRYHEVIENRKKAKENITPVRSGNTQQGVSPRSDTPLTPLVINSVTDTAIHNADRDEVPQANLTPIKHDVSSGPRGLDPAQNIDKMQPPLETQPDEAVDSSIHPAHTVALITRNTYAQPPSVSPRLNSTLPTQPPAKPARPVSNKSSSSASNTQLPTNTPHTAQSTAPAVVADPSLPATASAPATPAPPTRRSARVIAYLRGLTPFGTTNTTKSNSVSKQ